MKRIMNEKDLEQIVNGVDAVVTDLVEKYNDKIRATERYSIAKEKLETELRKQYDNYTQGYEAKKKELNQLAESYNKAYGDFDKKYTKVKKNFGWGTSIYSMYIGTTSTNVNKVSKITEDVITFSKFLDRDENKKQFTLMDQTFRIIDEDNLKLAELEDMMKADILLRTKEGQVLPSVHELAKSHFDYIVENYNVLHEDED